MNLFKRNQKKSTLIEKHGAVDPALGPEPDNAAGYLNRGYAFYSQGKYSEAESDFNRAIALDPKAVDAYYGLGMTLKAQKRGDDSIKAFNQVNVLLDEGVVKDQARKHMLHRLAFGHINEIRDGDWNLEKEIWQRVP